MPTQNSAADIVSSQWQVLTEPPELVSGREPVRDREFRLLRACCGDPKQVSQALRPDLRWDEVFKQAAYHRVLPALYVALGNLAEVPASIQSALRARYLRHCQRAMRFSSELATILRQFDARGIPAIAQKGPALAHVLYGDSTMRQFGDLDLLVRPADVPRAVGALTDLGYEKNLMLSPRQEKAYLQSGCEYVFGRGDERNMVELQWNLLPRFYAVDVDIDELFAQSREVEFEDCRARMLALEDQLIFLCTHAAKHQWAQLGMVRDIGALAGFDLDWEFVLSQARRLGILRIVLVSLQLADELMGRELAKQVAGVKEIAGERKFVAGIIERMTAMCEIHPESPAYFRLMLQIRERWSERAQFLWRLATTSSVGEWQATQMPEPFFPLYSGIRVVRLLRRFASRS